MNAILLNIQKFQRKKEHRRKRVTMDKWAILTALGDTATEEYT